MKDVCILVIFSVLITLSGCKSTNVSEQAVVEDNKDDVSLEEFCEKEACRRNFRVVLRTESDTIDQVIELYAPVVQGTQISLLPGDKVYVEAEFNDDMVTKLTQVSEIVNAEKTIVFDFKQMDGKVDMMLSIKNPFEKFIKFNLDMVDFAGQPHQTSSCPVLAGGLAFEAWPHPIPEIIVTNVMFLNDGEPLVCKY